MTIECETEAQTKKGHIFIHIKGDMQKRTEWLCTDKAISSTYKQEHTLSYENKNGRTITDNK